MSKKKKVIFILGPTAVGKSEVAIALAKLFSGEIISADSVQVFKGLDIGSAKLTKADMQNIVHFGIDIKEPNDRFTAFDFAQFAKQKIDEISSRGHLPIVVGGTGLFVKALVGGYDFGGQGAQDKREEAKKIMASGLDVANEKLRELDEKMSAEIDKNNPVRVCRALEIALAGGKKGASETDLDPLIFALNLPREVMYDRINRRTEKMFENGLVSEVENLLKNGTKPDAQSMHAIGYKEVVAFLSGEIPRERMVELVKQHSRNYAKRQLTFLRKMDCVWVDMTQPRALEDMQEKISKFLEEKND